MIGQKNIGVKHFFHREIEVQVQENLNLDHVFMAAKGRGSRITYWRSTDPTVTAVTMERNLFSLLRFLAFNGQLTGNVLGHNTVQQPSSALGVWPVRVRSV